MGAAIFTKEMSYRIATTFSIGKFKEKQEKNLL